MADEVCACACCQAAREGGDYGGLGDLKRIAGLAHAYVVARCIAESVGPSGETADGIARSIFAQLKEALPEVGP